MLNAIALRNRIKIDITAVNTIQQAKQAVLGAWPAIKQECLAVLGSELHYQATIYHCLRRDSAVPIDQIGMNVKMWIEAPVSKLFKQLDQRKHKNYHGGFEPIPDIVLFSPHIKGDWRRRNNKKTLLNTLVAIDEVKASERKNGRLGKTKIVRDIDKLAAHREEVEARGAGMYPIVIIIDSARFERERMTEDGRAAVEKEATACGVGLLYVSPEVEINTVG